MNVEIRQLEAFAATARTASFTAAARELGIGQPAVSQAVRRMESRLGLVLFQRDGRGVALTPAASALLPSVEVALEAVGAVQRLTERLADGSVGTLRLVSTPGSLHVVRHLLEALARAHPGARLDLVARPSHGRRDALRRGEIEFALVRSTPPARGIAYTLVHREPWRIVIARDHPLADASTPPPVQLLTDWPFASLGDDTSSPALTAYRAATRTAGNSPNPGPHVTSLDDLLTLILTGRAWTLVTASNTPSLAEGVITLPAPSELGRAETWLAHRIHTTPLEDDLLAVATDQREHDPT